MSATDFRLLLESYLSCLSGDAMPYATQELSLILPEPDPDLLRFLFRQAVTLFQADPIVIDVPAPCIIVGDIHGQLLDLLRILSVFGRPGPIRYLFLGDLVDRGEFSIETLVIPLLLKSLYPDQVFIIRGNHEFPQMCSQSGFLKEITDVFGNSKLYEEAVKAFREMPLAARVDGTMLCVHGGIGPDLMGIDTIQLIMRPIDAYDDPNVEALVWSDPTEKVQEFERSSARGAGFMFGAMALTRFLERSGLNLLVRAHECVADGFEAHHAGRCMTVFSASNYCNSGNRGAVLEVVTAQAYRVRYFAALPFLARKDAIFKGTGKGQMFRSRTQGMQPKIQSPSPGSSPVKRVTIPSSTSATLPPLMPMEFEGDQTQPALQMMRIAQLVGPGRQRRRASCA